MEASSGRRLLDPLGQGTRKGTTFWQTRSHAINDHDSVPADCIEQVACRRNLKSDTLHAWASSEDRSQECLEMEATKATAAAKYTKRQRDAACGALPRQINQTQEVHGHPLWRKSMMLKLNSEFKEPHKMQCLKIKEE